MLIPSTKVYLASQAIDGRKSYQTLAMLVQHVLEQDPFSGQLFVFYTKQRKLLKMLYWHLNGFCLLQKRLSKGKFIIPASLTIPQQEISYYQLQGLLQGIDCWQVPQAEQLWYRYMG